MTDCREHGLIDVRSEQTKDLSKLEHATFGILDMIRNLGTKLGDVRQDEYAEMLHQAQELLNDVKFFGLKHMGDDSQIPQKLVVRIWVQDMDMVQDVVHIASSMLKDERIPAAVRQYYNNMMDDTLEKYSKERDQRVRHGDIEIKRDAER